MTTEMLIEIEAALAETEQEPFSYSSTQATNCAGCGKHKHTPLRIDAMGGYVCLTCIDQKLGSILGEFGYPEPQPREWQELSEDEIKRICYLGPVYAPNGKVERTPLQYLDELKSVRLEGIRQTSAALRAKNGG